MALRQLATKSVRNNTNNTRANKPTDKALTCTMANTGRAEIWRVAKLSHCGERASFTAQRKLRTASQDSAAKKATAPAKPSTTHRPNTRSRLTAMSNSEKPNNPAPMTPKEAACGLPTSRRITRKGGTRANCKTGGKPKATNSVRPVPTP